MAEIARAGSQKWLQIAVNRRPELINFPLQELIGADHLIESLSPREEDGYREYKDGAALRILGIEHLERQPLSGFWPERGPVWDALGRTSKGALLLVEAKAHIPELLSGSTKAAGDSLDLITSTLQRSSTHSLPGPPRIGRRPSTSTQTALHSCICFGA